jgi:hypothetical protein
MRESRKSRGESKGGEDAASFEELETLGKGEHLLCRE